MPTFTSPGLLWGLLILPVLTAAYVAAVRRPTRYRVSYSTGSLLAAAAAHSGRRQHLSAALFLTGIAAVILALARPEAPIRVPADRAAIVLSIDVSGSMRSTDIFPSRIDAAKAAAKQFIDTVPDRVRIGLVAFAGYSTVLSEPTTDHARLIGLIDGLGLARRTAIGDGLLEAVAALPDRAKPNLDGSLPPIPADPTPGFVVLMSDGRNNAGIDPLQAAQIARDQKVRVYTIGLGRPVTPDNAWTIGGPMDEETLQAIATMTGGQYYHASSARSLLDVYKTLARRVGWERRQTEVSALAAGLALLALLAAAAVSWLRLAPLRA
jgi:Ca-activated chloride channel family protein